MASAGSHPALPVPVRPGRSRPSRLEPQSEGQAPLSEQDGCCLLVSSQVCRPLLPSKHQRHPPRFFSAPFLDQKACCSQSQLRDAADYRTVHSPRPKIWLSTLAEQVTQSPAAVGAFPGHTPLCLVGKSIRSIFVADKPSLPMFMTPIVMSAPKKSTWRRSSVTTLGGQSWARCLSLGIIQ